MNTTKKKHRAALIIMIIVLIGLVTVIVVNPFEDLIQSLQGTQGNAVPDGSGTVSVRVLPLELSAMDKVIRVNGNVIDPSSLDVYPEVAGKMTSLLVSVGDRVQEGQELAVLDPSRAGMVYKSSIVTSPGEGTVLALPFVEGAMVSAQTPIVRLGLIEDLEVVTYIAEQHIGEVGIGTKASLTFAAFPSRTFNAEVTYLSPVLNAATRTLEIRLTIEDPQRIVKSGMFPSVTLYTEHRDDIISIPVSALLYEGDQGYVYTADEDGVARKKMVSTGIQVGTEVEITEGLSAGEHLVIEGHTLVSDGALLNIVQ